MSRTKLLSALDESDISWLGKTGAGTGVTLAGATGWRVHHKNINVIFADINIERVSWPRGFSTTIQGETSHAGAEYFLTRGGNVVFAPTATAFRVYVEATNLSPDIDNLARFAEDNKWVVSWASMNKDTAERKQHRLWQAGGDDVGKQLVLSPRHRSDHVFELRLTLLQQQQSKVTVMVPFVSVNSSVWLPSTDSPMLTKTDLFGRRGFTVCVSSAAHPELSLHTIQKQWGVGFLSYVRVPHIVEAKLLVPGNSTHLAPYMTAIGQSQLGSVIARVLEVPNGDIRFFEPKIEDRERSALFFFEARMAVRVDNAHLSHRVRKLLHINKYAGVTTRGKLDHRFNPPLIFESVKEEKVDGGTVEAEGDYMTLVMAMAGVVAFVMVAYSSRGTSGGHGHLAVDTTRAEELRGLKSSGYVSPSKQEITSQWEGRVSPDHAARAEHYISLHNQSMEYEEDKLMEEEEAAKEEGLFSISLEEAQEVKHKMKRRDRFSRERAGNVRVVGGGLSFEESVGLDTLGL
jgi:hypothetical protein